jgi:hypothetical protein
VAGGQVAGQFAGPESIAKYDHSTPGSGSSCLKIPSQGVTNTTPGCGATVASGAGKLDCLHGGVPALLLVRHVLRGG